MVQALQVQAVLLALITVAEAALVAVTLLAALLLGTAELTAVEELLATTPQKTGQAA